MKSKGEIIHVRMAPTHQRSESDELVGEDIDLGLVQLQLVRSRPAEGRFPARGGLGARVHLLLEEAKSALALGFRAIERQVRPLDQTIGVVAASVAERATSMLTPETICCPL